MTKIEDVPLMSVKARGRVEEFLDALTALNVGQSFLWEHGVNTNERQFIRAVSYVLKRQFTAQTMSNGCRVGRLA